MKTDELLFFSLMVFSSVALPKEVIRKHLIKKLNVLDAVIGLPANLFFGTGIPVCVLVLKRERNGNADNILFIDASKDFEAGKNQNILRQSDIDKIVDAYQRREDIDKVCSCGDDAGD